MALQRCFFPALARPPVLSVPLNLALPLAICVLALSACGDDTSTPTPMADAGTDTAIGPVRCGPRDDPDADFLSSMDEGTDDPDGDGIPNNMDTDSDGDGFSDLIEAGDEDCNTPAFDSDRDGIPDYLDTDANGDGIPDAEQLGDADGDGIPDWADTDTDGDGIPNVDEVDAGGLPVDTDGDGIFDSFDVDSDGDSILDAHEGATDADGDGIPNFRDLDSDDDTIMDAVEAGDGDPETPPSVCAAEINPRTEEVESDGLADFADFDSDNDGVPDGIELEWGTDPCNINSDGDGFGDLVEIAYAQVNCPDGETGETCACPTSARCGIPDTDYFLVLPFGGDPQDRDLDFATDIRVADIFFLTDTTGSMGGTLTNVKNSVGTPGFGLIDRISELIPDAWFAGGQHDDMPFSPYGSSGTDEAFLLAIRSTPPTLPGMPDGSGRDRVTAAFNGIGLHSGADGPESHTEALYQIVTGEGETWTGSGGTYTVPAYAEDCLDTGWGAPCFRDGSLPIIVHFTDICAHEGPPGEDTGSCAPYTGITPAPHTWADAVASMNRVGAKYVGVNTRGSCAGTMGPMGSSACYYLTETARATRSTDFDLNPLVYDLPDGSSIETFSATIAGAIQRVISDIPFDITTRLRDDASDPFSVDATRFIKRRQPACNATPPTDPCWTAPDDVEHDDAVAAVDANTFYSAVPGTRVLFRITFQNDFHEGGPELRIFIAYIDVSGGGTSVLDTRQVFIVVPASDPDFI